MGASSLLSTSPSLLGCPDDVYHSIFALICKSDLRALCSVHCRLRTLAEPYLYSQIQLTWQRDLPHPIAPLLRSILRRPRLASYIRSVSLVQKTSYWSFDASSACKILVSEPDLEECLAFVKNTSLPYRNAWLNELHDRTMDAFIAVLLSQPLRLTHLSMSLEYCKESQLVGQVLRSTLFNPNHDGIQLDYQHLKSVSLDRYFEWQRKSKSLRNTDDVLPLFYLPSIEDLFVSIDNPVRFSWPVQYPPICSSLRSLKVIAMREPFLGQLLSVTNKLHSFHWEWVSSTCLESMGYTPDIDLDEFMSALSFVRPTLQDLTISAIANTDGPDLPTLTLRGSWKQLATFDSLKTFNVPLYLLIGASVNPSKRIEEFLPRQLEFLTINDDLWLHDEFLWRDYEVFSLLESWLRTFHASTPYLRGISLYFQDIDNQWNQPIRDKFRELCTSVGIQGEITKLSKDMREEWSV